MCDVIGTNPKTPSTLLARVAEVRASRPKPEKTVITSTATTADIVAVNRSLQVECDEISAWILRAESKMQASIENEDSETFTIWDRVRRNYSDQKVKNLLAQSRLGIDSGAFIGRAEIERLFTAFAGRAAISIARMRDAIAPKLVGMKDAAEAGRVIYDATWRNGYVKPFVHAKEQATFSGCPPGWWRR